MTRHVTLTGAALIVLISAVAARPEQARPAPGRPRAAAGTGQRPASRRRHRAPVPRVAARRAEAPAAGA